MIVYTDVFSGDEMISDSYKLTEVCDGLFYEAHGKLITKGGEDIDALIGANPSAEEGGDEGADDGVEKVIDIIDGFRLVETVYDKKSFTGWFKTFMKKTKAHLEETNADRVDDFMKAAQTHCKKIISNVSEYQFYTGENMDPEASLALAFYGEGDITPTFWFFKDALKEVKM